MLKAIKKKITAPVIIGGISVVALAFGLLYWFRKRRSQEKDPPKPQEKKPSESQKKNNDVEEPCEERIEEEEKWIKVRAERKHKTTKLSDRYRAPPELDEIVLSSKKKPDTLNEMPEVLSQSDFAFPNQSPNQNQKGHKKSASSHHSPSPSNGLSESQSRTTLSPPRVSDSRSPQRQRGFTMHSVNKLKDDGEEFEPYSDPEYESKHAMSYEYCRRRGKITNGVSYEIALNLSAGSSYEGYLKATFSLEDIPEDLFLDAHVNTVNKIVINNSSQKPSELYAKHKIWLPAGLLQNKANVVQIYFKNEYSNDGSGLNSVLDPNQLQYLWTRNAPANAHKFFPCFDQPSIRASFKLFAIAPQQWDLISNEPVFSAYRANTSTYSKFGFIEDLNSFKKAWEFNETPPISPYLFTVCAGPFEEIRCMDSYKEIKMSVFCRKGTKTLAKESAALLFHVTNTAIKYFEEIFGCPYPFSKYDMVLCPDFFWGSMENPGAVIFSESAYLFSDPSDEEKLTLAYTALNELAHMWFGNLISMEWWESHWLVESFAAFMAYHTLENLPPLQEKYPGGWIRLLFQKDSSYAREQLQTAHPLLINVSNTSQAELVFDEILNAKGAACLKQLVQIIGFTNFCKAMNIFCAKYAWKGNVGMEDFFGQINAVIHESKMHFDLEQWKREWIETPGLNVLEVQWEVSKDGKLEGVIIRQEACNEEFPILRKHFIRLGLFEANGKSEFVDIRVENTMTTTVKLQRKAPPTILANFDDIGYVKIRIDDKSLSALSSINKIENHLARALIWNAQIGMVHDTRLSCFSFVEMLIKSIEKERHPMILYNLLKLTDSLLVTYLSFEHKNKKSSEVLQKLYQIVQMESWELNPKDIEVYLEMLVVFAREPSDFAILIKWLKNENANLGFRKPKTHEIWQILIKVAAKKVLREDQLLQLLKFTHDLSESDSIYKSTFDIVLLASSLQKRQELWRKFLKSPQAYPIAEWEYIFKGFNHEFLASEYEFYIEPFFNALIDLYTRTSWEYFKKFYTELFPKYNEGFELILSKIEEVLTSISKNDTLEEGAERLVSLLTESLEETKKRRYCFSLNTAYVESSQKNAFEYLFTSQNKSPSNELEHKVAMQNILEHLKTEDTLVESPPEIMEHQQQQEEDKEEEAKFGNNKQWKKNESDKNEGDKFEITNSVFKGWEMITKTLFQKMFATDAARFSVLPKQFAENQTEYKEILKLIEENYYMNLVYTFMHIQADSNKYPQIGWQEINSALKNAKIFNRALGIQDCEKMVLQQLKDSVKNAKTGFKETSLLRFEFVELIIRMGLKKYATEKQAKDKIEKFLQNDILRVFKSAQYIYAGYRFENIQTITMNNLLQLWIEQIKKQFAELKPNEAGYVTLKALTSFLRAKKIQLIEVDVLKCFILSKMLVVDELSDENLSVYFTMCFPEFLEFLIRVAGAVDDTQDRPLTDKVQRIFPRLF